MTNKELAERHISDALSKGYITLEGGTIMPVSISAIIQLARAVVKDEISKGEAKEQQSAIPRDMFSTESDPLGQYPRIQELKEALNEEIRKEWQNPFDENRPLSNLNNS